MKKRKVLSKQEQPVIQSWLGHSSPTVTRIYARIEDIRVKRLALEKFPELWHKKKPGCYSRLWWLFTPPCRRCFPGVFPALFRGQTCQLLPALCKPQIWPFLCGLRLCRAWHFAALAPHYGGGFAELVGHIVSFRLVKPPFGGGFLVTRWIL